MRIAIFSDIHGNPFACWAVLDAIAADGDFDAVVAAGDLCFGGSDPARCVDLLQSSGVRAVYGNTDGFIAAPEVAPPDELHRSQWDQIKPDALWVRDRLASERVAWLAGLPFELRFQPNDNPADDLLVVHANPKNVEDMIFPASDEQRELFGEVRQPDDDPGLAALLAGTTAAVVACGHFHYTSLRRWRDLLLVNVAPCSMPAIDHDPRARYTVFTWTEGRWEIARRWAPYDEQQEVAALRASDLPHRENYVRTFMR